MNEGTFGVRAVLFSGLAAIALIGACESFAADTPPDAQCVAECSALNTDPEFCQRACSINVRDLARAEEPTDWRCMTACRERGGRYSVCRPYCVKR